MVKLTAGNPSASQTPRDLDLKTPYKKFTELVMHVAISGKIWKDGMKVDVFYKTRNELTEYLPTEERLRVTSERRAYTASRFQEGFSRMHL